MMSSTRNTPSPQHRARPRTQPATQTQMNGFFSPHGLEGSPFLEIEHASRNIHAGQSFNIQASTSPRQAGCGSQLSAATPHQHWLNRLGSGGDSLSPQLDQQAQPLSFSQAPFTLEQTFATGDVQTHSNFSYPVMEAEFDVKQLFPELDLPAQVPIASPSVSQSGPLSSNSVAAPPQVLTGELTSNFNYQPNIGRNVENMLGWARRAPTLGDRSMPHLKVDTDHLAPPTLSPSHRSPSSASSAGSSVKSSRRSGDLMFFGDLSCGHCDASFNTQGDLTHHLRSHQPYQSRRHVCEHCQKRFQYRKDLARHLPRHDPNRPKFYCKFVGCKYHKKGFGRQDHLDRHIQSQHKMDSPLVSRSSSNRTIEAHESGMF